MSRYVLTPTAQEDLAAIREYYVEEAGARIARQMLAECVEAFRFLARTPVGAIGAKILPGTAQFCSGRCGTI